MINILNWFDESSSKSDNYSYIIHLFGRRRIDNQVCHIKVMNYKPFFYVRSFKLQDITINESQIKSICKRMTIEFEKEYGSYLDFICDRDIAKGRDEIKTSKRCMAKKYNEKIVRCTLHYKKNYYGFDFDKEYPFFKLEFNSVDIMKAYAACLSKLDDFRVYEDNLPTIIRFIHEKNITPCGWIDISNLDYEKDVVDIGEKFVNLEIDQSRILGNNSFNDICQFKICSFDIECTSDDGINFPQIINPKDKIIQIGLVFFNYKSRKFTSYLISLGSCSSIPDTTVIVVDSEINLLRKFAEIVYEEDPDFLTGYNIFGFDYMYIHYRYKLLLCDFDNEKLIKFLKKKYYSKKKTVNTAETNDIVDGDKTEHDCDDEPVVYYDNSSFDTKDDFKFTLSRFKNGPLSKCQYKIKVMQSDAYGKNEYKYISANGRESFDFYCLVKKDHKLPSYKLDYVSENFINDHVQKFEVLNDRLLIYTKKLSTLKPGTFVTFSFDKHDEIVDFNDIEQICQSNDDTKIKYQIIDVADKYFSIQLPADISFTKTNQNATWGMVKDDIHPTDIFKCYKGSADDRALVGKYCVKDCELVGILLDLLDNITGLIGLSNVTFVPINYIFLYGQGIKGFSLIAKYCDMMGYAIPNISYLSHDHDKKFKSIISNIYYSAKSRIIKYGHINKKYNSQFAELAEVVEKLKKCHIGLLAQDELIDKYNNIVPEFKKFLKSLYVKPNESDESDSSTKSKRVKKSTADKKNPLVIELTTIYKQLVTSTKYEGAVVFDPEIKFYKKSINVLDFNSLYPSCLREFNGSPETKIIDKSIITPEFLQEYDIKTIPYNYGGKVYEVSFARKKGGKPGVIPAILEKLLNSRKEIKNKMKTEKDEFVKSIYEGLQLAYKVTANSIYGQMGATVGAIADMAIAAATTSRGRHMLQTAKNFAELQFLPLLQRLIADYNDPFWNRIDAKKQAKIKELFKDFFARYKINPKVIYGDTDSVFINYQLSDIAGNELPNDLDLQITMFCGEICGAGINSVIDNVSHNIENEKTLQPLALIAKKKYTGKKYTGCDSSHYEQLNMGIVLKRRDNAYIVKLCLGTFVKILLHEINVPKAIEFMRYCGKKIIDGCFPNNLFILSKTLNDGYKHPETIAHAVLADRIGDRNPGDRPEVNSRVSYIYIINKNASLQSDKIETPEFIKQHNIPIDYYFYITNQIKNPCVDFLSLITKDPELIFDELAIYNHIKHYGLSLDFDFVTKHRLTKFDFKTKCFICKKVVACKSKKAIANMLHSCKKHQKIIYHKKCSNGLQWALPKPDDDDDCVFCVACLACSQTAL